MSKEQLAGLVDEIRWRCVDGDGDWGNLEAKDAARIHSDLRAILAPAARLGNKLGRDPQVPRHVYQRVDSHCGQVRMTRSTNMEHVAHLQRMANESWIGSPERAALDAAIAVLSAPQPPAEAQPVACAEDRFEQFLQHAIASSPEPLRELGEYLAGVLDDDQWPAADRLLLQLATATPSAPVGVELLCRVYADAYHHGHHATVEGGYVDVLLVDRDTYWREKVEEDYAEELAQQPAAVDDADKEGQA